MRFKNNANLTLIKQDGIVIPNVSAEVAGDVIFIADISLPIEEGDILTRVIHGNPIIDKFLITNREYCERHYDIQEHFQIKFVKVVPKNLNSMVDIGGVSIKIGDIIVSGNQSKVLVNSQDYSKNSLQEPDSHAVEKLRNAILDQISNEHERNLLFKRIDELQIAIDNKDKPGSLMKYADIAALVSNHVAIIEPFLPPLFSYLQKILG